MALKPQKAADLEAFRDITDDVDESEFVPYASLFNAHTVITKNGELLQTIRIPGLSYEKTRQETLDLRRALRKAVHAHIPDDSFAVWFHTTRLEADLSAPGAPEGEFARGLHDRWIEKNRLKRQHTNEVYLSIVHAGQDAALADSKNFLSGLLPWRDRKWRNAFLDESQAQLEAVTLKIEQALAPFDAKRLGIVKEGDRYYSELLRFLNLLVNFVDMPVPVADMDLSQLLTGGEITFAYDAMEVRVGERRRFATMITVKEYREKSLPFIDRFLKLPIEFLVTQCLSFTNAQVAIASYRKQKTYSELSEEGELARLTGLDDILASDTGGPLDFSEHQLCIFIVADSARQLERNARYAINFLSKHGIMPIREDLKFEECYWMQLPGNFEFVTRLRPMAVAFAGGFANLYDHPVGTREGNHWGEAVTTFHTASGAPYFFNFHVEEKGHTTIVGLPDTDRRLLVNFLVAESTKFRPRLFYFDPENKAIPLINRLEGEMHIFSPDGNGPPVALNPFSLSGSDGNKRFLARWLGVLMRCGGQALADREKAAITGTLDLFYASASGVRSLRLFLDKMAETDPESAAKFSVWRRGEAYGHLFDHEDDVLDAAATIHGFHLADVMNEAALLTPLLSYLLQKSTTRLGDRPAMFVLDDGWSLIGQTHIAPELGSWFDHLTTRNAMCLFTTEKIEEAGVKPFTPVIMEKTVTQIYFPDPHPEEIYMEGFGLSELNFSYLDVIEKDRHHFLLRRMENTTIAIFDLKDMEKERAVLAGEEEIEPAAAGMDAPERERSIWEE